MEEVGVVLVDNDEAAGVVLEDETLVGLVETFEVLQLYDLLIVPATLLDVADEMRHGGAEIYHQVGLVGEGYHQLEEFHIGLEVTVGHIALGVVVGGEDIHALKDGAVLNDGAASLLEVEHIAEALFEEIDFHREGPSGDVLVIVFEIGVVRHSLELRRPLVVVGEHLRQGGLAAAYVSCYDDVHIKKRLTASPRRGCLRHRATPPRIGRGIYH